MLKRLAGIFKPAESATPAAQVAVFGKHPGWDDHIDDLGLTTPRLADAKRSLYNEALAGCIDSGVWERLPESQRLDHFDHVLVWRFQPGEAIIGKLWSSRDGQGRTRYPMAVVAHCVGAPLDILQRRVTPAVLDAAAAFARCPTRQSVLDQLVRSTEAVRATLLGSPPQLDDDAVRRAALRTVATAAGPLGIARLLYTAERDMRFFLAPTRSGRPRPRGTTTLDTRGKHARVPALPGVAPVQNAWDWSTAMLESLGLPGLDSGVLALVPTRVDPLWIDLIVGRPGAAELTGLRATPGAVAFTTDVPFSWDADFEAWSARVAAAWPHLPAESTSA